MKHTRKRINNMDKEEGKQLTIADHVESMLNSDGWKYAKEKLDQKILDLQSIANLDMTKPDTLGIQLAARTMAVDLVWAWLKGDIYGFIEQQEANSKKLEEKLDDFINRG